MNWEQELAAILPETERTAIVAAPKGQLVFIEGTSWQAKWLGLLSIAVPTAEVVDRERLIASLGKIRLFPLLAIDQLVGMKLVFNQGRYGGETTRSVRFANGRVSRARIAAALSDLQVLDGEYILQRNAVEEQRTRHEAFLKRLGGPVPPGASFTVDSVSVHGLTEIQSERIAKAIMQILDSS